MSKSIKVINLRGSYELLQNIKTEFLSVPEIKSVLSLKRELQSELDKVGELQTTLFGAYGVDKAVDGNYVWNDHPKAVEITAKMSEILNSSIEIKNTNFIEEDAFFKSVSGVSITNIDFLETILKISPDEISPIAE
jgi:hypothetical protein